MRGERKKRREGGAKAGEKMPAIVWIVPHDYRPDLGDSGFENFAAFQTPERAEQYAPRSDCSAPIAYARLTKKAAEALRAMSGALDLVKKPTKAQLARRKSLLRTGEV